MLYFVAYVTHLFCSLSPVLLLLGMLLKNGFDAIEPFISPLPLCSCGAMLCSVFFFFLTKKTHHHKTTQYSHMPQICPLGFGLSPQHRCARTSNALQWIPNDDHEMRDWIKEGHSGKTGSPITRQQTLGTVISPGALKASTKHLQGGGNHVTREKQGSLPTHIRGLPFYCPQTALCSMLQNKH